MWNEYSIFPSRTFCHLKGGMRREEGVGRKGDSRAVAQLRCRHAPHPGTTSPPKAPLSSRGRQSPQCAEKEGLRVPPSPSRGTTPLALLAFNSIHAAFYGITWGSGQPHAVRSSIRIRLQGPGSHLQADALGAVSLVHFANNGETAWARSLSPPSPATSRRGVNACL